MRYLIATVAFFMLPLLSYADYFNDLHVGDVGLFHPDHETIPMMFSRVNLKDGQNIKQKTLVGQWPEEKLKGVQWDDGQQRKYGFGRNKKNVFFLQTHQDAVFSMPIQWDVELPLFSFKNRFHSELSALQSQWFWRVNNHISISENVRYDHHWQGKTVFKYRSSPVVHIQPSLGLEHVWQEHDQWLGGFVSLNYVTSPKHQYSLSAHASSFKNHHMKDNQWYHYDSLSFYSKHVLK